MKAPLVLIVCVLAARVNSHEPSFAEITSSCADSVRTDEGRRLFFMLSQPFIDFFKTVMCLFRPGDVVHHGDTPLEHPLRDLIIKTAREDRDDDDDSKAEESSSKTDLIASCVQEANAAIAQDLDEALMKLANCLERFGATLSDGVSPGASSVADH